MGLEVWLATGLFFVLEFVVGYALYDLIVMCWCKPVKTWAERRYNGLLIGSVVLVFTVWSNLVLITARVLLEVLTR